MGNCHDKLLSRGNTLITEALENNPKCGLIAKAPKPKPLSYMEKVRREKIRSNKPNADKTIQIDDIPANYQTKDPTMDALMGRSALYDNIFPDLRDLLFFPPHKFKQSEVIYMGQWKDGKRHGYGELYWPDGSYYIGCWSNDEFDIKGELFYDENTYTGHFKGGKFEGHGTLQWKNGARYEGDFREHRRLSGIEIHPDGTLIQASFSGGVITRLIIKWADDHNFDGLLKHGVFFREGTYQWPDGRKFSGTWEFGTIKVGWFYWPDGRKYHGAMENGLMNGTGDFYWPDGKKYSGAYVDGKKNGEGVVTLPNGLKFKTQWVENRLVKHILVEDPKPKTTAPSKSNQSYSMSRTKSLDQIGGNLLNNDNLANSCNVIAKKGGDDSPLSEDNESCNHIEKKEAFEKHRNNVVAKDGATEGEKEEEEKKEEEKMEEQKGHEHEVKKISEAQSAYYEIIMGCDEKISEHDVRVNDVPELMEIFQIPPID